MDSKYSLIGGNKLSENGNGVINGFPAKRSIQNNGNSSNNHEKSPKKAKRLDNNIKSDNSSNGSSNSAINIQQQRQSLPIYPCKQRLIHEVRKAETIVLMGETGSGKTTQLPQFLYDGGFAQRGYIAITQPRRVAAISIAKRVAQEMNCNLGELVGFTVRFEDCTTKLTKIRYITDGCLLREAISDRLLKNYSVLILDEVHERSINTDVLFGIAKEAQKQRKLKNMHPLKIIVMSATMDIDHFGDYFGVKGMYLEGRTYPVRVMHAKEPQSDYVFACLVTLFQIHREAPANHDILIFLTGQEEIESMTQQVRLICKKNDLNAPNIRVLPLYSQLSQTKQLECFNKAPANTRKVIIATNIAETSLTIPGIRYVIDSGYVKRRIYDPSSGIDLLKVVRISQAQSWQRCGRAGREAEGFCYRAYTRKEMENFENMPKPEILRSNICSVVLQLLAIGIECRTFDFLDKPSAESIETAYRQLHALGAIRSLHNPELTEIGTKMSKFPLDPRYSKLLLTSPQFDCVEEILTIVSVLSGENIYITATEKRDQAALAHAKFESKYGDHLTLLNIYNAFSKTDKIKLWCHENFFNVRNLLYAKDVRNQLKELCEKIGIEMVSCLSMNENENETNNSYEKIRKCLLVGLYNNIAEFVPREQYYLTISGRQKAKIHPSSVLSGKTKPKFIIFNEMVSTERNFLRCITEINPEWIQEILPNHPYINRIKGLASMYS